MSKYPYPTKPGLYWAVLDEGNGETEVVLIRVQFFEGTNSFEQGILCYMVDGSERSFDMKSFSQELIQPSVIVYRAHRTTLSGPQCKITWHGEAKPPKSARDQQPVIL